MMIRCTVLCLGLLMAACATPYHERGWANLGVDAAAMGGDVYRVQARLNMFSNQERAQDFLFMRAAETAQENGAIGFIILSEQDTTARSAIVTPGTATTTAYGYGNTATATTTYRPPQAYGAVAPGGIITIRLVRDPAPEGLQFYNAAEIIAAVGPRVR